jgi:hypothetical protein
MWYKFAQTHPYIEKAIERFNVTKDPNKAGYILSDGRMLDFSDGYDIRDLEHHSVFDVMPPMPDPVGEYPNLHKQYVIPFMKSTDSIRISKDGDNLSVEIHTIPSDEQIIAILKSINKGDNFFYEIPMLPNDPGGAIYDTNDRYIGNWLRDIRKVMTGNK